MRLTSVVVRPGGALALERDPQPSQRWQHDDEIRWLTVEKATRDELAELFDRLGVDGSRLAEHINGTDWMDWTEREHFYVAVLATPSAWLAHRSSWFHLVVVPRVIVCVHPHEIPELLSFAERRWLSRPGPEATIAGVLLHVIQTHVEEDGLAYYRLRLEVEQHAAGLAREDQTASVEGLEDLMTRCDHLATAHLEWQLLLASLEFARSNAISVGESLSVYRHAGLVLRSIRDGIGHLQRRLRELQQQHLHDQQSRTDFRIRILTIISAIFLPLTLIAGIYGMNFENLPGLHASNASFVVLLGMAALAVAMSGYFAWKGWFR